MDISEIVTDSDLESEGVRFDIDDESWVVVARSNNKEYQQAIYEKTKKYRAQIKRRTINPALLERIIGECMAEHLIKDWGGLKKNGVELPFSKLEAKRLCTDPKYQEFKDMVADFSNDAEAYRVEEIEDDSKNSQAGSNGL